MDDDEYSLAESIFHKEGYDKGEYCHKQSWLWGFQEGINSPSDSLIKKILKLAWEYYSSDIEVNNLTTEGEFKYVKKHLEKN